MINLRPDELNKLYDAALEFGESWRRPLHDLAAERLPDATPEYRAALVAAVGACRAAVEAHVESVYTEDDNAPSAFQGAQEWVAAHYPWMTPENISHGVSQAGYYAWHG